MKFNVNGREVESYHLTNDQLLKLYQETIDKEQKEELNKIIINRFESECCIKPGETDDELFANNFGSFVNGKMRRKERVAEVMCMEHRYLQQEMFKVCLEYIKKLSENYQRNYFDDRNRWSCQTSSMIVEALKDKNWYI